MDESMHKTQDYLPGDSPATGRLTFDAYGEISLGYLPEEQREPYLGPFAQAYAKDPADLQKIAELIHAPIEFIAELDGNIVGVLRGSAGRLQS